MLEITDQLLKVSQGIIDGSMQFAQTSVVIYYKVGRFDSFVVLLLSSHYKFAHVIIETR